MHLVFLKFLLKLVDSVEGQHQRRSHVILKIDTPGFYGFCGMCTDFPSSQQEVAGKCPGYVKDGTLR